MMNSQEAAWIWNFFRKVDMFSALSVAEMSAVIDHMNKYHYNKGKTIVKQGTKGDSFFIIYQGRVNVILKKGMFKTVDVGELGPEQFFGEIALLLDQPRSATIVAKEDTDCFVLLKSDFQNLVSKNPTFANIVKTTGERRSFELEQK